jgi:hypothetical protein
MMSLDSSETDLPAAMTDTDQHEQKGMLSLVKDDPLAVAHLVMLECGDITLLLPSDEIVSMVSSAELTAQQDSSSICGTVEFMQQSYSVFSINKALQLSAELSPQQQVIVLFSAQQSWFALACQNIKKLEAQPTRIFAVPSSMRSRKQPFSEFAIIDNEAVGVSSSVQLLAFLHMRGAHVSASQTSSFNIQGAI